MCHGINEHWPMTLLLKRLNLMVGDSSQGLTPGRHKQDVIKKKKDTNRDEPWIWTHP